MVNNISFKNQNGDDYIVIPSISEKTPQQKFHIYKDNGGWSSIGYFFLRWTCCCSGWTPYKDDITKEIVLIKNFDEFDQALTAYKASLLAKSALGQSSANEQDFEGQTSSSLVSERKTPEPDSWIGDGLHAQSLGLSSSMTATMSRSSVEPNPGSIEEKLLTTFEEKKPPNALEEENPQKKTASKNSQKSSSSSGNPISPDDLTSRSAEEIHFDEDAGKSKDSSSSAEGISSESLLPSLEDFVSSVCLEYPHTGDLEKDLESSFVRSAVFMQAEIPKEFTKKQLQFKSTFGDSLKKKDPQRAEKINQSLFNIGNLRSGYKLQYLSDGTIEENDSSRLARAVTGSSSSPSENPYALENLVVFVTFLKKYCLETPIPYQEANTMAKNMGQAIEGLKKLKLCYWGQPEKEILIARGIYELTETKLQLENMLTIFDNASLDQLALSAQLHLSTLPFLTEDQKIEEVRKLVASWGKLDPLKDVDSPDLGALETIRSQLHKLPIEQTFKELLLAEIILLDIQDAQDQEKRQSRIEKTISFFKSLIARKETIVGMLTPKLIETMNNAIAESKLFEGACCIFMAPEEKEPEEKEEPEVTSFASYASYAPTVGWFTLGIIADGASLFAPNPLISALLHKLSAEGYKRAGLNPKDVNEELNSLKDKEANHENHAKEMAETFADLVTRKEQSEGEKK